MALLLLLVVGFGTHLGSHSQDWCSLNAAGAPSVNERCHVQRTGPVVQGQDRTAIAPRFGQDFSGIRTEIFSDENRHMILAPGLRP